MRAISHTANKPVLTARGADKFWLYEQSVQSTEAEIEFLEKTFKKVRGRSPLMLREDFCGTAMLCVDWVKGDKDRQAMGVDLDAPTLAYARKKRVLPLGDDGRRVRLFQKNVLDMTPEPADITVAFNFSYCVFKDRATMLKYCKNALANIKDDGAFVMDIYGGPDAQTELVERKRVKGFTYVWEQDPLDAVTNFAMRHISFEFKDNTRLSKAFSYDWRIWSLPELRDILLEAGFRSVDVYWEGNDGKGSGNGVFKKVQKAENEQSFIAYIVAWK